MPTSSGPTSRPPSRPAAAAIHPAAGCGQVMGIEHEDERGRALAYLAAWDVDQARLVGAASRRPASSPSAGWSSRS
jgi:hypothetical protein